MQYTVIFIFDNTLENVVLVEKNRGPYPNKLNGVGGKIEPTDDTAIYGSLREVKEETALELKDFEEYKYLITVILPDNSNLYVFAAKMKKGVMYTQVEDELLRLHPVADLRDCWDTRLAGEGNIPYFIRLGVTVLSEGV